MPTRMSAHPSTSHTHPTTLLTYRADYMTGRGTVNIAVKTPWGMHCSGVQRDSLGSFVRDARAVRRRASDSDQTPPIDLLLLYCVCRPTVFSRFLVHKSNESNVQFCSISEQNFSEHSFAV